MKLSLARMQTVANVAGAALLWWLAAPLLSIGGWHPFDGIAARVGGLLGIGLLAALAWVALQQLRRRRNARLFEQVIGANAAASEALVERFSTAMRLLRAGIAVAGGNKPRWWRRGRQIYQLPWYVFIGAPGAGKTTALLHSGLRFPLAERLGAAPVAGIGGTRQCDWWFTDQAVFIDTAGRYTTQDSHAASDSQEWQLFLQLLRRHRPVQPINGVIVTVSVPDLLHGGAELERQAAAVDRRLQELRTQLGLSFPVYLLVTKADLLAGFVEFFGDFDATRREQVWGITFDDTPAGPGEPLPADLAARLAALPARVAAMAPRRLQEEPLLQRRSAIYHFAAQVEALLPALETFARHAFRRAGEAPPQRVRGIHLSSGTQEGNPIDRVLGELSRGYGLALRALPRPDDGGKAYFLASLLQRLVIKEAPLAGTNLARRQRRRWLVAGVGAVLAGMLLLACAGWWFSYRSNVAYVAAVNERVQKVARQIDPAQGPRNIDQLLPLYSMLSQLAASGQIDPAKPPWGFDFGLFQGPRLTQSADQTYHRVLDQTLAPLLARRLNQALRQDGDAAARYEALRISLMLVTPGQLKRDEVRRWAAQAFATPTPGRAASGAVGQAPGAGEQQEWLLHLDALLERNAVLDAIRLDEAAIRSARTALAAIPIDQLVYERVLRRAREQLSGDRTLADLAGPAAVLAFAPPDAASGMPAVAAIYTRAAWRELIEPALEPMITELADEASWVMGDRSANPQRPRSERQAREALSRQLGQRHAQATIAQWDRLLSALAVQVPGDGESLDRFTTSLAAPNSPLRQLMARIATEFPAPATEPAASAATLAYDAALNEHFGTLRDYARDSGLAGIDRLITPAAAVLRDPASAAAVELGRGLRAEAAKSPRPLREIWAGLAEAIGAQQERALDRKLSGGLTDLAQTCRRLIGDRFPFVSEAKRDMPYADFARVFGPNGLLDAFFRAQLAGQVDTRSHPWRMAAGAAAPAKAQAALRSFEFADDIRRLFFPAGSELPQLRLRLTPVGMDGELLLFSVDVDGQLLRYENGPRRAKSLVWPGPAATQRVLLRILPTGPSGVGAEVHEGPWALLRVLQRGGWQRGSGNGPVARLEVDGRSLTLEVAAEAPVNPALIGELPRFRCPETW